MTFATQTPIGTWYETQTELAVIPVFEKEKEYFSTKNTSNHSFFSLICVEEKRKASRVVWAF